MIIMFKKKTNMFKYLKKERTKILLATEAFYLIMKEKCKIRTKLSLCYLKTFLSMKNKLFLIKIKEENNNKQLNVLRLKMAVIIIKL